MTLIQSRSPQNPDDIVEERVPVTPEHVQVLAGRVRAAQLTWRRQDPSSRAAALRGAADRLRTRADEATALIVREVGKPAMEARAEVSRAAAILDYYAQSCFAPTGELLAPTLPANQPGLLFTERRPRGVAGLVTPWNFPLAIPVWKAAPALAAGNGVLLKPSPSALACGNLVQQLFDGLLPANLLHVVPGGADTGQAVIQAADVASFTGSESVGRKVVAAATQGGLPVQAEMGGQNAAVVLPDADPATTAIMLAGAAMGYAGQKCTATRRIIVVGDAAVFTEALVAAVAALRVGDPTNVDVVVGPVITEAARHRVLDAVSAARAAGGRVLTNDIATRDGFYVAPTLLDSVDPGHSVACEETFGPVATIFAVPNVRAAAFLANSVRFGLVTSVHGRDIGRLFELTKAIDTGLIRVNAPTTGVDFHAPFGGEKASSHGPREQGTAALDFYTSLHTVTFATPPLTSAEEAS
ncbi:aldehyde dehydrogenase [Micromonospora tulbaghiae]|uniref:Aldehyde dehydrogenase n=1 Tax=Micromonospora tulbaghiae TaxID=479978 RepID=A0A386WHF9_9ACTN|nr:aldehyde dehydrogenase family protein [Micromonospora tulbaghiae]AYF26919.1 aldehyde dehydrogenase [Micromonospora tulbaghiae]